MCPAQTLSRNQISTTPDPPMPSFFSRRPSRMEVSSPGSLGGMLADLDTNSPSGPLRTARPKRAAARKSPYGRSSSSHHFSDSLLHDAQPLLTPGRKNSNSFVADKHIMIKKPEDGPIGITFQAAPAAFGGNVLLCGIAPGSVGEASGMLVGDMILAVNGTPVANEKDVLALINEAQEGSAIFFTVSGSTRRATIDKRLGDCGMTCAAAAHIVRGVLLKRIAKGSLADNASLYPGDTILAVNNKLVNHHAEAVAAIDALSDLVHLTILGESQEVEIENDGGPIGVTLTNHDDPTDGAGVKVLHVEPGGKCARAGISSGDTLLSVNGILCTDHEQASAMTKVCAQHIHMHLAIPPHATPPSQCACAAHVHIGRHLAEPPHATAHIRARQCNANAIKAVIQSKYSKN